MGREGRTFFRTATYALLLCRGRIAAGVLDGGTDCATESATASRIGLAETHTDRALGLIDTVNTDGGRLGVEQRRCQRMVGRVAVAVAGKRQLMVESCKARMALGFLPEDTDCIRDTGVEALLDRLSVVMGRTILALCPDAVTETLSFGGRCEGRATGSGVTACALCAQSDEVDKLVAVEYGSGPSGLSVARRITDAADCVDGPLSRCRPGDCLLANDQIRVVVQDIQRNMFGIGQFGGQIIDADLWSAKLGIRTGLTLRSGQSRSISKRPLITPRSP